MFFKYSLLLLSVVQAKRQISKEIFQVNEWNHELRIQRISPRAIAPCSFSFNVFLAFLLRKHIIDENILKWNHSSLVYWLAQLESSSLKEAFFRAVFFLNDNVIVISFLLIVIFHTDHKVSVHIIYLFSVGQILAHLFVKHQ